MYFQIVNPESAKAPGEVVDHFLLALLDPENGEVDQTAPSLAGTATFTTSPVDTRPTATVDPESAFMLPAGASRDMPGVPAITPQAGVQEGLPAIRVEDVVAYVEANQHPYVDSADAPVFIENIEENIELLKAPEAAKRIQSLVYRPDDAQVYVVTLRGEFSVPSPPVNGQAYIYSGHSGYVVFDARTGNLLNVTVDLDEAVPPKMG